MTGFVPEPLELTQETPAPHILRICLHGDLDHTTAQEFLEAVTAALTGSGAPRELRIGCAGLRLCDSSGLSALLVARRRAGEAGALLFLDDRGPALERLLDMTGTLAHLTGESAPRHDDHLDDRV
ncbi:STAS domain-containing protein [Nonomuraea sp. NPDC005501]|uniref:STAS domain-containing protein n=1 Tax=Nonomuraea sp. NPDC005501 TaxID=3156884 RepID=UPI00339FA0B4